MTFGLGAPEGCTPEGSTVGDSDGRAVLGASTAPVAVASSFPDVPTAAVVAPAALLPAAIALAPPNT